MKLKSLAVLAITGLCVSSLALAATNNTPRMLADDSSSQGATPPANSDTSGSGDSSGSDMSQDNSVPPSSGDDSSGSGTGSSTDTGTGDDDY